MASLRLSAAISVRGRAGIARAIVAPVVLRVAFDDFAETVSRVLSHAEAYLSPYETGVIATAADPGRNILVVAETDMAPEPARAHLEGAGIEVFAGVWEPDATLISVTTETTTDESSVETRAEAETDLPHVVAVAYLSDDNRASAWIDAYPYRPTELQALNTMHREMMESGEVRECTLDEFVRIARAQVIRVTPEEIRNWITAKLNPES